MVGVAALVAASLSQAVPATAADDSGVSVDERAQQVTIDAAAGTQVSIQLPGDATSEAIDTSSVPTALFRGEGAPLLSTREQGSTVSSFATDDGVQTLIQIPDASAPKEYRFPLNLPEGGQAAVFDDGSVIISDANGQAVSGFRAPWAVDAKGEAVPTRFHLEGADLVQTVGFTAETAFPVTADPDLGAEWWGYYVQFTRSETQWAANVISNNQGPQVLAGVACGSLPGPAALACGVALATAYFRVIDPIQQANSEGRCVAINYPWIVITNPQVGWGTINATAVNCRR
ncbi:hypothetical protein ABE10_02620 [Bacillus toyonensis]|nr:hypothetical protein [Bacillus toyonensis]